MKIIIYFIMIYFISKKLETQLIILYIKTNILNKTNDKT
jgi:hypothetical protein